MANEKPKKETKTKYLVHDESDDSWHPAPESSQKEKPDPEAHAVADDGA